MKKIEQAKSIIAVCLIITLLICSCSKTKKAEAQNQEVEIEQEDDSPFTKVTPVKTEPEEKNYLTKEEFWDMTTGHGVYQRGGVEISNDMYDIPKEFQIQKTNIFGFGDEDYSKPEKITAISMKLGIGYSDDMLFIEIPETVYNKTPQMYLEAEHEGKKFFLKDKEAISFSEYFGYEDNLLGYKTVTKFINRNLFSKSNEWILRLKACSNDELIAEKKINLPPVLCGYVVYKTEYENPFKELENRDIEVNETVHMIYKGKGSSFGDADMPVMSYGYYYDGGTKIAYIPFLCMQSKTDIDGISSVDLTFMEPGQYKIDFYNGTTKEITYTTFFDYLNVNESRTVKHVEKKGTEWKVNSAEGLYLRNAPKGIKIALLPDQTELCQTEETLYPFEDLIDTSHGFWIPVKITNLNGSEINKDDVEIICNKPDETDGWVFSGFLTKKE